MWYKLNSSGEIEITANKKVSSEFIEATEEIVHTFDGKLVFKSQTETEEYKAAKQQHDEEENKNKIRLRRERECFSVINRGALWYEKLTEEQRTELSTWYQAWLDAPQTDIIPIKPEWIN